MKSKISFFNPGLFKSTLRRFWPLWIIHFAGWFLFMPMLTLINSIGSHEYNDFVFTISESAIFAAPIIAFIMAIISAMAVFSFMYSSRSTGLVASLPVRRETIFSSVWLGGVCAVIGSNIVVALLTFLFSLGADVSSALAFKAICTWLGVYSMQFILFFGIASITAVMTGSIVVLPILYVILNFFVFGMEAVIRTHFSYLIWGMANIFYDSVLDFLSPIVYMTGDFTPEVTYRTIPYAFNSFSSLSYTRECTAFTFDHWLPVIIYCIVGLIFSVAALIMFRKRRMESAGDVVAIRSLRPVFKYGVAACSALCGGLLLYAMLYSLFNVPALSVVIMIPSMMIFAFIGYFGAKMLLEKSFHVFRGGWVGFVVLCCLCAVFTLCCDLDVCGIGSYVPEVSEIESMSMYSAGEIKQPDAIKCYRDLHLKILSQKDKYEKLDENFDGNGSLLFSYTLKNGRTITREYVIPGDDEIYEEYYDLMNSPAVLIERFTPRIPVTAENCDYAVLWTENGYEVELTPEQFVDFYENALIPDIKAGRKIIGGDVYYLATMEVTLISSDETELDDYYNLTIDISADCTECVSWIQKNLNIELTLPDTGDAE
jgi:ABC-2 type transport system permease protein